MTDNKHVLVETEFSTADAENIEFNYDAGKKLKNQANSSEAIPLIK